MILFNFVSFLDIRLQSSYLSNASSQNPYPSPPPSANTIHSSPPFINQRPIILPKPLISSIQPTGHFPAQQQQQITNCVKVQSYAGATSSGPKCVKIEPVINTTIPQTSQANITIITTSKPITIAKVPVIKMPMTSSTSNANAPITFVKTGSTSYLSCHLSICLI
jgi:hypothetical protein